MARLKDDDPKWNKIFWRFGMHYCPCLHCVSLLMELMSEEIDKTVEVLNAKSE